MDSNSNSAPKSINTRAVQPSIRSFFQPRTPQYSAPPGTAPSGTPASPPPFSLSQPPTAASHGVPRSSSTLPPQACISKIEPHHVQPLRRINSLLLPMNYPDSFYHKISEPSPANFSRVILWLDSHNSEPKVVGGIVCRLDPSLAPESTQNNLIHIPGSFDIYLQSLALLSPYRGHGLANEALQAIITAATEQKELYIRELYAHAWTESEEALKWYAGRGFKQDEQIISGYYRRLKPDTAWILRRKLNPSDHFQTLSAQQKTGTSPTKSDSVPEEIKARPDAAIHAKSFQDRRPDMEWNDLPDDVLRNPRLKPPGLKSADGSAASSRSSSKSGMEGKAGKKKRQYPAAAFGS
ncbi:hypothetical protein B0O99DRAFT_616723 [Bisporella sp. PMI_857]|nr:hypothetical protein B0O99DRAFT_616723 [Bisporella sp. PMI_857]